MLGEFEWQIVLWLLINAARLICQKDKRPPWRGNALAAWANIFMESRCEPDGRWSEVGLTFLLLCGCVLWHCQCKIPAGLSSAWEKKARTQKTHTHSQHSLDDHRISCHDILCGSVGRKRHRETVLKCTLFRWCSIVSMLFQHTDVNVRLMHNVTNILLQSIVINRANCGVLQVIWRMGYSVCPVVRLGFRVKIAATDLRPTRRLSRKNLAHAAWSWPFGCLGSGFPVAPRCSGRQREAEGRAGSRGGRGKTLGDKSSFLSSGYYFLWW